MSSEVAVGVLSGWANRCTLALLYVQLSGLRLDQSRSGRPCSRWMRVIPMMRDAQVSHPVGPNGESSVWRRAVLDRLHIRDVSPEALDVGACPSTRRRGVSDDDLRRGASCVARRPYKATQPRGE